MPIFLVLSLSISSQQLLQYLLYTIFTNTLIIISSNLIPQ